MGGHRRGDISADMSTIDDEKREQIKGNKRRKTQEENEKLTKHYLMKTYGVDEGTVTSEFVKQYGRKQKGFKAVEALLRSDFAKPV